MQISRLIVQDLRLLAMTGPVDLDNQARCGAVEVGDVGADRMLATPARKVGLAAAKPQPQKNLGRRQAAS
jgi:hypothetical protein